MGKGKEEEKKGIEVYLLWSIIVLNIEIFRYGIDGVFFWIVKKCSSKGLSVWIFEYVRFGSSIPSRGEGRGKRIFFKGGKMDETRWGE